MTSFVRPYRLTVRTAPFHGVNRGSIPRGVTSWVLSALNGTLRRREMRAHWQYQRDVPTVARDPVGRFLVYLSPRSPPRFLLYLAFPCPYPTPKRLTWLAVSLYGANKGSTLRLVLPPPQPSPYTFDSGTPRQDISCSQWHSSVDAQKAYQPGECREDT